MSHRIFITGYGIAEEARQYLREANCLVEFGDPDDTPADIARKLKEFRADGIIVRAGRITAEVLAATTTLRVVCKHGVGTDNIDIQAATARGIPVMFTPLGNYESVAEHTLALILALARRIPAQDERVRRGLFDKKRYDGFELRGKTLGLVGCGRVGRRLCRLVEAFEMDVVAYQPSRTAEGLPQRVSKAQGLDDVLSRADVLTLHCPLTSSTRGMINGQSIALMKRGAYVVNTARGGLINESDLFDALNDGRIAGAALDVYEVEPPAPDNRLFGLDNVIFTPHVAGLSDNSYKNMGMDSVRNVLAVLGGEPIDTGALVNGEVLERL